MGDAATTTLATVTRSRAKSTPTSDTRPVVVKSNELADALQGLQSDAYAFAQRFINDEKVRADYKASSAAAAREIAAEVQAGKITAHEGAKAANALRNSILDMSRTKLSDLGLVISENAKKAGKTLEYLQTEYARLKFSATFESLGASQREAVWREIVDAAGRGNKKFNLGARIAGSAGRGFLVFGLAVTVWHIAEAEDKGRAAAKEVTATAGAGAGAAIGVGLVGLALATPPGWAVGLAIFVGAACGGIASSDAFDYFIPAHTKR
jgi:hypothetical protein